uniref:C-type lectin domain-containing protein n=1 Tax=Sphaeramia orbicularis TaxID=375764 RepID=A0A673CGR2_9TELE
VVHFSYIPVALFSHLISLYNYHYIKQNMNWSAAQAYCRREHTDLATVYNMRDMNRLCGDSCKEGWIGLHDQQHTDRTWHWSLPGVEYNESDTNWAENEPNDKDGPENTVEMLKNFKWIDVPDRSNPSFICYDGKKLYPRVYDQIRMTWLEAQKYCREHHTDLISGQDQLDDLKNHTKLNGTRWMIGLFRDTWRWSDGNGSSFRNWDQTPQSNHCNWSAAQEYCRREHTDLATVYNMRDMNRLCGDSCKEGWIGLHDQQHTNRTWHWSLPGVEYNENDTNWAEDEPDNKVKPENIVEMLKNFELVDVNDKRKASFICYNGKKLYPTVCDQIRAHTFG